MAKTKLRRQRTFEPSHSDRPSGLKVGDRFEVVRVRPFKWGRGQWEWQPEQVTIRLISNPKIV